MRSRIRTVLAPAIGAMFVVTIAGAAGAQTATPAASSTGDTTLHVGVIADLDTDNVFAVSAGSDYTVATSEYDMLLKFSSTDLTAAPSLATGCDHNTDYTVWTCHLRDGLKWSDGQPLTSEDVAFTYRFVIDNNIPQYKSYFPSDPTFETPDPTTLIWKAKEPTFAPSMPPVGLHRARARLGAVRRQGPEDDPRRVADARGRERAVHPDQLDPGPGLHDGSQPVLLGPHPDPEPDRVQGLHEPRSHDPGAEERGDRRAGRPAALADQLGPEQPEHHAAEGGVGLVAEPCVQLRRPARLDLHAAAGPARPGRPQGDRDGDRQERDRAARCTREPRRRGIRSSGRPRRSGIWISRPIRSSPTTRQGARDLLDQAGYVDTNRDGIREDPKTGQPLEMQMPASSDTTGARSKRAS